jgi:DNA polymerase-3 subunit gamma/tau
MLDQLVAFCGERVTEQDVLSIFGFSAQETVSSLCGAILAGRCGEALGALQEQAENGKDLSRLMADVITHLRDLLVMKADPEGLRVDVSPELFAALEVQAAGLSTDRLLELIEQFAAAETRMKWAPNKKLHFEIAIIKAVQTLEQATLTEILDALAAIRSGVDLPARAPRANTGAAEKPPAPPLPRKAAPEPPGKVPESSAVSSSAPPERRSSDRQSSAPPPDPSPVVNETPESAALPDLQAPAIPVAIPVDTNALWTGILVAVRQERPLILTWLEAGALLEVTAGAVRLGFPPKQRMAMESLLRPNNRGFLEKLFTQLIGAPRILECEEREGLVVAPSNLPPPAPAPAPADPMEEFKNDPLIRKALEIFQAEIQPA